MRQDMYTAISGKGAFKKMAYPFMSPKSKDEHKEHQLKNLSILCSNVMAIRSYGSACMNLCLMAEGQGLLLFKKQEELFAILMEIVDLKLSEPKVKRDHTDKVTL
ncbi:unnamed protein product [Lepeophtheirus salmonis]|uniref:(salmon louse) hypothetical protein n=1 Tax=Lepeophtheirus salmonis TaxID=72036 RepID=A0A7R8HAS7_LEPSM|nr:unnamed protein product [Lepeophtheirus salmonis]CAF2971255.1 unnamed protein product [Lepeophtheirus salmonis]